MGAAERRFGFPTTRLPSPAPGSPPRVDPASTALCIGAERRAGRARRSGSAPSWRRRMSRPAGGLHRSAMRRLRSGRARGGPDGADRLSRRCGLELEAATEPCARAQRFRRVRPERVSPARRVPPHPGADARLSARRPHPDHREIEGDAAMARFGMAGHSDRPAHGRGSGRAARTARKHRADDTQRSRRASRLSRSSSCWRATRRARAS